ncbi:MAG TPA: translocation/assembly module TamB domain-containing protein [Terriglobales bacterium]|nr:translocation/assembly module TamB domain-containing protein [Terriglobales bacterium]
MSESQPKPPRTRTFRKILLAAVAAPLLAALAVIWYVHTSSFQNMVHRRVAAALEQMTGGRVEVGRFSVVPLRFRVEAHDLTIHGREAPGEVPYAHVDNLVATIKIISVFEREFGFNSLTLDHPIIHIIIYPDGSTNQPTPTTSAKSPVGELFSASIRRLEVRHGELLWNNQRIPLDFTANGVFAELKYSLFRGRYQGYLRVRNVDTRLPDFRPFSSAIQAQFGLGQNQIEVGSLAWVSGHSRLEASGQVDDFRRPKFTGTYNARIDLADLASVTRISELRGGMLELGGKGSYSADDFLTTGKMLIKDFEWRDAQIALRNASLTTQYDASPAHLKISNLQAHLLGGSAVGDADVLNWLNSTPPAKTKVRAAGEQKGTVNLRFRDISVSALGTALATKKFPLDRLKFAASGAGTVAARWKGSPRNTEASFAFDVAPPEELAGGQIPITARASGIYRRPAEELEISQLNVATRATQFRAAGKLSSSSSLRLSATTTDLREWQPILNAFGGPQIPVNLKGRASFNGTATGKLSDFMLAGRLQMSDFDTLLPASDRVPERQVHWDSLIADVRASPRTISARNGMLVHGPTAVAFDLSALLQDGQLTETSPFTVRLHVRDGEFAELQSILGYNYPAGGRLNLSLNASGTRLNPHGEGQLQLTNATLYGQPISRFTADLRFGGGEAALNNIVVIYRDSRLTGGAAFNPDTRAFHFNLSGTNFDLLRFPEFQKARFPVEARMDFTAEGSGTVDAPVINAHVRLRDLVFDKERAGDFTFDAVTRGADLQLTGRSSFDKGQLAIDGTVHLRNDWPADLTLRFADLDIDALLRSYLHNGVTGHSSVAGGLQLRGPLRQSRDLNAVGDLNQVSLNVANINLTNEGPIRFRVDNQALTLDQLRLLGAGTDITAHGKVQLSGEHELDLRADGQLNLKLLENLSPDLTAGGMVTVAVNVGGSLSDPAFHGKLEVVNGSISSMDLPNGLSDMKGVLLFNQNRLQIQSLTAHVGGGTVNLGGFMTYSPRLAFDITIQGQDVRLRPAGISATTDDDLRLTGTAAEALLSGNATVMKLSLAPDFDFARYLETSKQTTATLQQANSILNKLRLDVHVVTTPELQMQSTLAKLSGDADLHLRGTATRPTVLGRVDIMEGDVYFSGTKYRLERGEITFRGPVGIQPILDLQASTHVRDYDITLGVNGTPEKLNFTYRSEPPLPTADIMALLALGRTQSESAALAGSSSSAFSQETSNAILSQALNATLSNRAQRLFGISRIKVDPQGLNTETTPTRTAPAVTIEQQVSNNLTLTYSTEVSQTSQQIIQAEYNITHSISIRAVRDQNGVVSFDVRLRQRRK